jgi:hypothetical protein
MYGLDFVAPNGCIDKMPGGGSEQGTLFTSCTPGAAWPVAFFKPCGLKLRMLRSGSHGMAHPFSLFGYAADDGV